MAFDPDAYLASGNSSSFDPDAYLGIEKPKPNPLEFLKQEGANIAQQAAQAAMASSPAKLTQKFMQTDPATMQRQGGVALPIVGGLAAGPIGAAAGELARQVTGTAFAPDTVPQTPAGRAASVIGSGIAQDPKILNAIPGVSKTSEMIGKFASKMGSNAAKFGEALTGAKAKDLEQGARQGISTYGAPSMEKAQGIFGKAMETAGIPSRPPLEHIIDPQLQNARETALHVGQILDNGAPLTAQEALLGRQAVDRIYNATPLMDRSTRGHLADLRTLMDDELSKASGPLKDASTLYRKAIVKSNLLNPFKVTKQGQMSAVAPMIASLAASAGLASGHRSEAGLGGLGYLAASSPLVAGLAATTGGSAARGLNAIAQNPAARQVLLQLLQRLRGQQPGQQ